MMKTNGKPNIFGSFKSSERLDSTNFLSKSSHHEFRKYSKDINDE